MKQRILQLLLGIYILAFSLLFVDNIVQSRQPASDFLGFWLVQMAVLGLLFIVPGYLISTRALRPLIRWLAVGDEADIDAAAAARRAALTYPWKAIAFFALFGIVAPALFHSSTVLHDFGDLQLGNAQLWREILALFLNEFSLSIALGTAFAAVARPLLRPFLQILPPPTVRDVRLIPVRLRIILFAGSISLITGLPMLITQMFSSFDGWEAEPWRFAAFLGIGATISLAIGWLVGGSISSDIRTVADELRALTASNRPWRSPLAMANDDEVGDLALAFNAVRARAEADERELEAELDLARRVQAELLPKGQVRFGSWSVTGLSLPAREVGGDFYDVISLDDKRFAVAVGDASGKGMPAALLMAAALSVFRAQAREEAAPGELLGRMNRLLCETLPTGSFVAMFCAVIDTVRMTCTFGSAGHVDPLLLTQSGSADYIPVASLPLGVDPEIIFSQQEAGLHPGQRLVLYSDGLPETRGLNGAVYGFERLAAVAARLNRDAGGAELLAAICRDVRGFSATDEPDDDLTVVVVEAPI